MARASAKTKIRRSKAKYVKKQRSYVPGPQQARIMQRYVKGQSIRQIAKQEHRNQRTVSRIVKSEDIEKFRLEMREQLWGLVPDAISNIRRGLEQDPRLGLNICKYLGIEPAAEALEKSKQLDLQPLTTEEEEVQRWVEEIVRCGVERHLVFGTPLKMIDEVARKFSSEQAGTPGEQPKIGPH